MGTTHHKAIHRRLIAEVWNQGHLAVLDELAAPDIVRHTPLRPEGIRGVAAFKQHVAALRAAFPEATYVIEDVVAEGDRLADRWTMRGVHAGEFRHAIWGAAPASGKPVRLQGMSLLRFVDGQIAETWIDLDLLALLAQLGLLAAPGQPRP